MTYSPEQRADAMAKVITGLRAGVPLTVICAEPEMPGYTTIWEWRQADPAFSEAIAHARDIGFDSIAAEGLRIVDDKEEDPASRRVRADYRLKLLAKWDPKRYGDKIQHTGDGGGPMLVDWAARAQQAKMIE